MSEDQILRADPSNAAQVRAWDGNEGEFWAAHAQQFDDSVAVHHRALLAAAAIGTTERVLDIGCGAGQTTRDAARLAAQGDALGVDLSSRMLEEARRLAAEQGVTNAHFEQADAQVHPFTPQSFDVAISRSGAMFFGDPDAAFSNIGRALVAGGRLVIVAWQGLAENEWMREISGALAAGRVMPGPPPNTPGPFALADPDRVRSILGGAGFIDVTIESLAAPIHFGRDTETASAFILGPTGWMLDGLDEPGRDRALDNLHETVEAHRTDEGVTFASASWVIEARRP
jgi:SAM-dependent methyltransferase